MYPNLYEKCVIYIQVYSGEDVKFYLTFSPFTLSDVIDSIGEALYY